MATVCSGKNFRTTGTSEKAKSKRTLDYAKQPIFGAKKVFAAGQRSCQENRWITAS
jgi:hypothetical protein